MTAFGKRFSRRQAVAFVKVSPLNRKSLRFLSSAPSNVFSARHASTNEGVDTHTSIFDSMNARNCFTKSSCAAFVRL